MRFFSCLSFWKWREKMKRTPLYERHLAANGKMVEFAGYELPVQYESGVIAEHLAVRNQCGLFDVSHMGEIIVSGKKAVEYLNRLLCNDYSVMEIGSARYSLMMNDGGGIVDDLIVYKVFNDVYFVVVNASNTEKDYQWMKDHLIEEVQLSNVSEKIAQLALQGPLAKEILLKITTEDQLPTKYYTGNFNGVINGVRCLISRTGYTGEFGYEIYCENQDVGKLWDLLLDTKLCIPCGLGARDTLRLEAGMPLYGHEMSDSINPIEAGLSAFVKVDKDFIGKAACLKPITRTRVGLKVTGRGIIREQCEIYKNNRLIGVSTSGTHAPYLGYPIAMALIAIDECEINNEVEVDVRGRKVSAQVVALPFYKRKKEEKK